MKEIYEMKGAGRSVRGIAGELGLARNTVRRYLISPEAIRAQPRPQRAVNNGLKLSQKIRTGIEPPR